MKEKNKKEQEKSRKRRIFILLILIIFTGVILTTSTYAWFTANKTVTVDDIDVNVAASNGLQLSVDGNNWKPFISKDDIINAIKTYPTAINQVPTTMVPVSSIGETDNATGFMNMYKGDVVSGDNTVEYANILTATKSTETNTNESGDFVAFDLFFQVTSDTPIYLTNEAKVTSDDGKGIENAARIAFIKEGHLEPGAGVSNLQALKSPETPIFWEPNNNAHTEAAIAHAQSVYSKTISANEVQDNYYGVKAPISQENQIILGSEDSTYFDTVTPNIKTGTGGISSESYEKLFTNLEAGVTKVRIYMWIEGQDVDCQNDASGSDLIYSLQFSILDKA